MRKIFGLIAAIAVVGLSASSAAYAVSGAAPSSATRKPSAVVDAGNKICPVSGAAVDGKNFYDYNGKRYGLCCPMCAGTFKYDPKKYAAIADKEIARK